MANNILILSRLNPVQFYKEVPDVNPQFNSRLFDDWYFSDTIFDWEEQMCCFPMPWQLSDIIQLQLQCNYGPINLQVVRCSDGAVIDTIAFNAVRANFNVPDLFIYEIDVELAPYPAGEYLLKIVFGNPIALTLCSEKIILSEKSENSLLLSYSHNRFYGDMIFETGFATAIRIPGTMKLKITSSKDTVYEDQPLNMTMLRSVPFRIWKLRIGIGEGIPDYLHDKLMWILGCLNVQIDGKYYTKGGEMEEIAESNYPMRGWTIDMREKLNRGSRIYENETAQDAIVAVMVNSDSKGFGADNGGNETVITDVI